MKQAIHQHRQSISWLKHTTSGLALCLLAACGGGDVSAPGNTPPIGQPPTASGTTIAGKIVAPDGSTPISNALVYIERSSKASKVQAASLYQVLAAPATLACGEVPDANWLAACTASDGSFSLDGTVADGAKLVAVKGAFRLEKPLTVSSSQVSLGNIPFSSTSAAKMAVVTGAFDRIQDVLAKLGFGELESGQLKLGTEKFTLYNGDSSLPPSYKQVSALFVDADNSGKLDIFDYNIVFLNCGLDDLTLLTPANVATVRRYVEGGGRLYVSDLSYNAVEQVFPSYIDFYGSDATPAGTAESLGSAEVGQSDITVTATLDPELKAWMQGVSCAGGSCLLADGTVLIDGFLNGWAVINGAHAGASVRTWASGAVTYAGVTAPVVKPLTISFSAGLGRVTYTSYHNEAVIGNELLPQQRILQYLVFQL